MERSSLKAKDVVFWPTLVAVVALDYATKWLVVRYLVDEYTPHPTVFGTLVRMTLAFNTGAAFSMNVGDSSRWVFTALALLALMVLARVYYATRANDRARALALALVCAGAIGNVIDRLRPGSRGVVDFIDVGIGNVRFYTFNVADVGVSLGALLLAWVLWRDDREPTPAVLQESGS